ncbi:MAG TPA: PAS domain S-box protein, partial [Nitrospirae bacterium]|nr:PAS domain S-box protein [Nitrospirota bacterium]
MCIRDRIYQGILDDRRHLQTLTKHIGNTEGVMYVEIYDNAANVIAHTEKELVGLEPEDKLNVEFAKRILDSGETLIMEHPDEGRYELFVPVSGTHESNMGQVLGVINLAMEFRPDMDLKRIKDHATHIVQTLQLSVSETYSDFESHKKYMQHLTEEISELEVVNHMEVYDIRGLIIAHTFKELIGETASSDHVQVINRILSKGGTVEQEGPEPDRYSRFIPIATIDNEGDEKISGVVEIAMDMGLMKKRVSALYNKLIATAAVLAFAMLGIMTLLMRKMILEPVNKLSEHTKLISEGDLTQKVSVNSDDELGDLASAFNTMTAQLKESKEELFESEERYRSLFDSHLIGVAITTLEGKIRSANKTFQDILGFTESELQSMSIKDITHPGDIEKNMKLFNDTVKRKLKQYGMEKRYFHKNGRILWCDLEVFAIYDEHGDFRYCFSMIRDITERKQAEEELRKNQERLLNAQQVAKLGFWDLNLVTGELYWSDEIYRIIGAEPQEFVPSYEKFIELVHPDDLEFVQKNVDSAIKDNVPYDIDFREILSSGEVVYINAQGEVTRDENDKPIRFMGTMLDITERKQAEEEKQRQIINLEKADKSIKASLKEKEFLLKEIHHRVKNNMAVISSLLSLQSRYVKDPVDKGLFLESQNRIKSMALIHDRLYQSEDFINVNFKEYVKDLSNNLFVVYDVNPDNITLQMNIEDVRIGLDNAVPCGLILNELITNSLKHAFKDTAGGELMVEIKKYDQDKIQMVVSDNGCGIPDNIDLETADTMGMRIVNTLVGQLNGTMEVHNSGGTAFIINF